MPSATDRWWKAPAWLGLAALLAVMPMLLQGPSCGHDFDFHVLSWLEAARQFAHGVWPRWAYSPAWNAGEPRFVFYPPLSWALGGLLGLALPWGVVPAAFTWAALSGAGWTMWRLARRWCGEGAAVAVGVVYLANPYMLFTAYERTAYGELLAAAWLPLLFGAALAERVRVLPVAGALAVIWLTNAPAAVMASYALAVVMVVRLCLPGMAKVRMAVSAAGGVALGLGLAAFYIMPAAYERRFVRIDMAVIPGMRPQEHFLFHRMGGTSFDDLFHDAVVRTASWVALGMLLAVVVAGVAAWRSRRRVVVLPLVLLAGLIAFLLTPASLVLWQHVPELGFLQFPWRLTALLAVMLGVLLAVALERARRVGVWVALPLVVVLVWPAWRQFRQRCDQEDTVAAQVEGFRGGAGVDATDEYMPVGADGDAMGHDDPAWWVVPEDGDRNAAPPAGERGRGSPDRLTVDAPAAERLVMNRRAFPSWRVLVNGKTTPVLQRADGLIEVELPPGRDEVKIEAVMMGDRMAGLGVSGVAGLIAVGLGWKRRRSSVTGAA